VGGKNHQPCNKYLEASTRLSRDLSLGNAQLELANVALEDVILAELAGGTGSVDPILLQLSLSTSSLNKALADCTTLREKLEENDFVDLPTLSQANLESVGARFGENGLISPVHWMEAVGLIESGGFRKVLEAITSSIIDLESKTRALLEKIQGLAPEAQKGRVGAVLEENQDGNTKVQFARLYTAWQDFNHFFLASSLISTELWYIYTGHGSLFPQEQKQSRVA
jgi:hypothetical protein